MSRPDPDLLASVRQLALPDPDLVSAPGPIVISDHAVQRYRERVGCWAHPIVPSCDAQAGVSDSLVWSTPGGRNR